jgi:hypothetical protein
LFVQRERHITPQLPDKIAGLVVGVEEDAVEVAEVEVVEVMRVVTIISLSPLPLTLFALRWGSNVVIFRK